MDGVSKQQLDVLEQKEGYMFFDSVNSMDGGFTDGGNFMLTVNEDQVIRSGTIISSLLEDVVADENNDITSHQLSMLDAPVCPMPAVRRRRSDRRHRHPDHHRLLA